MAAAGARAGARRCAGHSGAATVRRGDPDPPYADCQRVWFAEQSPHCARVGHDRGRLDAAASQVRSALAPTPRFALTGRPAALLTAAQIAPRRRHPKNPRSNDGVCYAGCELDEAGDLRPTVCHGIGSSPDWESRRTIASLSQCRPDPGLVAATVHSGLPRRGAFDALDEISKDEKLIFQI